MPQVVANSGKDVIFSPCCFMHTNFDRGVPEVQGQDYYEVLTQAAIEVGAFVSCLMLRILHFLFDVVFCVWYIVFGV